MDNSTSFSSINLLLSDLTFWKIISKGRISTEFGDLLYSSYEVLAINPRRFLVKSSERKIFNSFCLEIFLILPRVEKLGFIVNG